MKSLTNLPKQTVHRIVLPTNGPKTTRTNCTARLPKTWQSQPYGITVLLAVYPVEPRHWDENTAVRRPAHNQCDYL